MICFLLMGRVSKLNGTGTGIISTMRGECSETHFRSLEQLFMKAIPMDSKYLTVSILQIR